MKRRKPGEPRRRFHGAKLSPGEVATYCAEVFSDPEKRELYEEALGRHRCTLRELILRDAQTPPTIQRIELSQYTGHAGEPIRVLATDDFFVAGVIVEIADHSGNELEGGAATCGDDGVWTYRTTTALATGQLVLVSASVFDTPLNMAFRSTMFRVGGPTG